MMAARNLWFRARPVRACVRLLCLWAPVVAFVPREATAHELCLTLELGPRYEDASPGDGEFFEDYGRDDGTDPYPAQRWLARVIAANGPDSGQTLWGWDALDAGGCTSDFELLGATQVTVRYLPWAYFASTDNSIVAYDCAGSGPCQASTPITGPVAASGSATRLVIDSPSVAPWETALWAASFAEELHAYWTGATTYLLTATGGSGAASNRSVGDQPTSAFATGSERSKFTVAHEYGHLQTLLVPEPDFGEDDVDDSRGGAGHLFAEKEYQRLAATEGFANFYSGMTWHDIEQGSADSITYLLWDGLTLTAVPLTAVECTYEPLTPAEPGYIEDECDDGEAVEKDWATALLELYRDEEVALGAVMTLLRATFPWPTNETQFWGDFQISAVAHLGSDFAAWSDIADDQVVSQ